MSIASSTCIYIIHQVLFDLSITLFFLYTYFSIYVYNNIFFDVVSE